MFVAINRKRKYEYGKLKYVVRFFDKTADLFVWLN